MLTFNNIDYIIISDYFNRYLKVYNILGECVRENFCEDEECVVYLKHYFSVKSNKHYIIKHTIETVRSYEFEKGNQYHIYAKLFSYNCVVKLINEKEYIILADNELNSLLIWNDNIIISGGNNGLLHFFDLEKEQEIKVFKIKNSKNIYFINKIKIDNKEYFIYQEKDNKHVNIKILSSSNINI